MQRIVAIIRPKRLEAVKEALAEAGFLGLNVANVTGRGAQKGVAYVGRTGEKEVVDMLPKARLELVVRDGDVEKAVEALLSAARTGHVGDGKIFISPVTEVLRVRTGERGESVL